MRSIYEREASIAFAPSRWRALISMTSVGERADPDRRNAA